MNAASGNQNKNANRTDTECIPYTVWCSEIGSLVSLDACNSRDSSDVMRTNFTSIRLYLATVLF